MTKPDSELFSYFGVFTFTFPEKPGLILEGNLQHLRIEVCPLDAGDDNRMGVMGLLGRETMEQNEQALGEIIPLSQNLMHDVKAGDFLIVKHGSTHYGNFEVLYIGKSTDLPMKK